MYQLTLRFNHGIFKSTSMMYPTFAAALFRGAAEMIGGTSEGGGILESFTIYYGALSRTYTQHDLAKYFLNQSDLAQKTPLPLARA